MNTKAKLSDQKTELEQRNQFIAYTAATEGIVLLKNEGVLPIKPCRIALYGSGAQYTISGGSGSGEVNVRHNITVQEGLADAGFEIVSTDWIERYDKQWKEGKQQFLRKFRKKLWWPTTRMFTELMAADYRYPSGDIITEKEIADLNTDTCIYVLSRKSGEGYDCEDKEGSFRLDKIEEQNIKTCAACFAHFILVINTGTPIDLSPLDTIQNINAIVYMGQLGMEGGKALADMLIGKSCPSGKLAVTWPVNYRDVPFGNEFAKDKLNAKYKEGIFVGYRYYDSFNVTPRFAFGYGLSYTAFEIKTETIAIETNIVNCSVIVTNKGNRFSGKEIVQIYVCCPGSNREKQRLVAFSKTKCLSPQQSEKLTIAFPISTLTYYDEIKAQTVLAKGSYLIKIGNSSANTENAAVINIDKQVVVSIHRNLCSAKNKISQLEHNNHFDIPEDLPVLAFNTDSLPTQTIDYSDRKVIISNNTRALMKDLTAQDYVNFCTGTGMSGEKKGFRTPGAVGHTTTAYINNGIPNVELCDGPAGVRLEKRAVQYANGDIRALDVSISLYEFFPDFLLKWFVLGNPKKGKMLYQYVTGFPVEAVVAQTWNTDLANQIGRAVGEEMSEFGVSFWLAPAMNIVRNPLCGRNYEYYSEDPLLTGKMAAATTLGCQAKAGNYVTLKHFCANNQETDRYTVSSDVDERVLREIYWKGFEIAIKEAHPHSIMTAYNKINGTYCANNKQLLIDLLRCEWDFEGVVMTDWMSTGKDRADEVEAIKAGVDIIMPGGKDEVKILCKAYNERTLPESELYRSAAHVIDAILGTVKE